MNYQLSIRLMLVAFVAISIFSCVSDEPKPFDSPASILLLSEDDNFISLQKAKLNLRYTILTSTVEEYSETKIKAFDDFKENSFIYLKNIYFSNPWLTTMNRDQRELTFSKAMDVYKENNPTDIPISIRESCLSSWIDCEIDAYNVWDGLTSGCASGNIDYYGECLNDATNNYMFLSGACEAIYDNCVD